MMPTFLSDPSFNLYLLLAVAVMVEVIVWLKTRGRGSLLTVVVTVGLLLLLLLVDTLVESPREQAVRRVTAMGVAASERRWGDVATHIAPDFVYHGINRAEFLKFAEGKATEYNATAHFTQFDRDNATKLADGTWQVGFVGQFAQVGGRSYPTYIEADFVRQPDGAYLMHTFRVYNYISRSGVEESLPGK